MRMIPIIAVVNESTVVDDITIMNAIPAFQNAVHYDYRPRWNEAAHLLFYAPGAPVPDDAWVISILDDADMADALGYHDLTSTGKPLAKVFARTDLEYGLNWTVTFTHELFEMLADPYCCLAAQTSNSEFYGYEVSDPVESDDDAYARKGVNGVQVMISNFVTPQWFQPGLPGPYDHRHLLSEPLEVREGGYVSVFTSGQGWGQYQMRPGGLQQVPTDPDEARFRDRSRVWY